ncbi:MAG: hypothetical protein HYY04_01665 [Chloroflexi bacterium]|nr:hypothetical protein [Chloroflexota bacterium]
MFSPDEVADFLEEYLSAGEAALAGNIGWELPAAVLHEWQESARALDHQPLLAEWSVFRGVATEEQAERLATAELRVRLASVVAPA